MVGSGWRSNLLQNLPSMSKMNGQDVTGLSVLGDDIGLALLLQAYPLTRRLLDLSGLSSHFCNSIQALPPILDCCSEILFWLLREKPRRTEVANLHKRQAFNLIQKQYPTSSTNWLV
jgi:hypothetical protein